MDPLAKPPHLTSDVIWLQLSPPIMNELKTDSRIYFFCMTLDLGLEMALFHDTIVWDSRLSLGLKKALFHDTRIWTRGPLQALKVRGWTLNLGLEKALFHNMRIWMVS